MPTLEELANAKRLPCKQCDGSGSYTLLGKVRPCGFCDGACYYERPDVATIWQQIKGRKPGTVRSKRPDDARAYYVWRMVRFHTGKDVTLPMTASLEIAGDPYGDFLAGVSEAIASRMTGHGSAGRARWRAAWYGEEHGHVLPLSAKPGGPVADQDKPQSEALELL